MISARRNVSSSIIYNEFELLSYFYLNIGLETFEIFIPHASCFDSPGVLLSKFSKNLNALVFPDLFIISLQGFKINCCLKNSKHLVSPDLSELPESSDSFGNYHGSSHCILLNPSLHCLLQFNIYHKSFDNFGAGVEHLGCAGVIGEKIILLLPTCAAILLTFLLLIS